MNDDRAKHASGDPKRGRESADTARGSKPGAGQPDDTMDPNAAECGARGATERTEDHPEDVGPASERVEAAGGDADFRDRWLRTEADFQNYRRRAQKDVEEARRSAEDRLLREVIEVLDDLDRALDAAPLAGTPVAPNVRSSTSHGAKPEPSGSKIASDDRWLAGVTLVAGKMRELLARAGVTPIDALGRPFDPHEHEALLEVDAPEGRVPGDVVNVVRPGYRRGDRVLRPARVVVARARVEAG